MTSPSCLRATVLRGSRDPRMPQIRPSNSIGPPVPPPGFVVLAIRRAFRAQRGPCLTTRVVDGLRDLVACCGKCPPQRGRC
jgi:hypothetical protein